MASDDLLEIEGVVVEAVKNRFLVETEFGNIVQAYVGGKMKKFRITVVKGDRVKLGVSPYDPTKGRITYRYK